MSLYIGEECTRIILILATKSPTALYRLTDYYYTNYACCRGHHANLLTRSKLLNPSLCTCRPTSDSAENVWRTAHIYHLLIGMGREWDGKQCENPLKCSGRIPLLIVEWILASIGVLSRSTRSRSTRLISRRSLRKLMSSSTYRAAAAVVEVLPARCVPAYPGTPGSDWRGGLLLLADTGLGGVVHRRFDSSALVSRGLQRNSKNL